MSFAELATQLAEIGRQCYTRGWVLGTSGNFSAVIRRDPLRLAITTSGVDKGTLSAEQIVEIDDRGQVVAGSGRASAEAALHLTIARARGAGAVLHTHSIWSTILSDGATQDGVAIEGYEMLKGLAGVHSHAHREWLPIINNSQDMPELATTICTVLTEHPNAHGFLLHKHGLYSWGNNLREARRHIEILEFLLETRGRTLRLSSRGN